MTTENVNGFVNIIQSRDHGELEKELDSELQKMNRLLKIRGGVGKISLTISLKEDRQYEDVVVVTHELKLTYPKKAPHPDMMFVDREMGLVTEDPRAVDMFDGLETSDGKVTRLHKTNEEDENELD